MKFEKRYGLLGFAIVLVIITVVIMTVYDMTGRYTPISKITPDMQGMTVEVRAKAVDVKEVNGNVYCDLVDPNDGAQIKGVMFKKTNAENKNYKILLSSGESLGIEGEVDVYKGELEIKIWQVSK